MTKKALIVVDVQNDFAHPEGSLTLDGAEEAIQHVNYLILQHHWDLVVYTMDSHPAETTHFAEHGGDWPAHCVAGTWGAEFHDELNVVDGSDIIFKGTQPAEDGYSGFTVERDGRHERTELDTILREHGIEEVEICGLAYDVCVKATALDANTLGYKTAVHTKATASVTEEGRLETNDILTTAGVTLY